MKPFHVYLTFIICVMTFSQHGMAQFTNCPPDDPNNPYSGVQNTLYQAASDPYGFSLDINYKKRTVGTRTEVSVDWGSLNATGNADALSDEAKRELIIYKLVKAAAPSNLPICSEIAGNCSSSAEVAIGFTSKCFKTTTCTYLIKTQSSSPCCNADYGDVPVFLRDGKEYLVRRRTIECGTKCCQKVFQVCLDYDFYQPSNSKVVICGNPSGVDITYPGGDCPPVNPSDDLDCETGQPRPCTGGCTFK